MMQIIAGKSPLIKKTTPTVQLKTYTEKPSYYCVQDTATGIMVKYLRQTPRKPPVTMAPQDKLTATFPKPDFYIGIIQETWIEIDAISDGQPLDVTIGNAETGRAFVSNVLPQSSSSYQKTTLLDIGVPTSGSNYGRDLTIPEGMSFAIKSAYAFDHVTLRNSASSGSPIKIRQITVRLNDYKILEMNRTIVLNPSQTLILDNDIKNYRVDQVFKFTTLSHADCLILYNAALELGHAWEQRYGAYWPKTDAGVWQDEPNLYCSEFASWIFRRSAGLTTPRASGPYLQVTTADMCDYFRYRHRFVHGYDGTRFAYTYDSLSRIQPGDYVSIDKGGHSTIFIGWVDSDDIDLANPIYTFDPSLNVSYFAAIGGNQRNGRVFVSSYSVTKTIGTTARIMWHDCEGAGYGRIY